MKTKSIRLNDDMAEWLRRQAFERRCTQQSIIDEALLRLRNASDVTGPTFQPGDRRAVEVDG